MGQYVKKALNAAGVEDENLFMPSIADGDLREYSLCQKFAAGKDLVIHLAGKVGGIGFNQKHPAEAFYDNASMAVNLIDASYRAGVKKFVGLGTVCEYPKFTPVPFKEEALWDGYPEETNAPYGLAKKMMLVQSQAYRQQYGFNAIHLLMVNLYGPGDNFDPESSHAIPALIQKIYEAKRDGAAFVELWGTGDATREFLYAEDAARGIVLAAEKYDKAEPVNLGSGKEISIKNLARLISKTIGFKGEIKWDETKPDGQPRRVLDTSRAEREFGFKAKIGFEDGLKETIHWYEANKKA